MKIYKHGIPGIGITGQQGKDGKNGPGFYFGTFDSFFTFIGDDILTNSSIDYDDIDYDITYVQNEERLNIIYKTGDILYIIDEVTSEDSTTSKPILYMVEVTEDLTTCTKEYLKEHIKQYEPFTVKYKTTTNVLNYPINIVTSNSILDSSSLFNLNKIYTESAVSLIFASQKFNEIKTPIDIEKTEESISILPSSYEQVPLFYNENMTKDEYINNGKDINHYTYENPEESNNDILTTFTTTFIKKDPLGLDPDEIFESSLNIIANQEKYLTISSTDNLYVSNLFVNKTNLGNIESYYTLYDQDLILDDNGNCYTLNETDFDPSTQSLYFDPSSFFKNIKHTQENYHFGYIHTFWNYTEDSSIINYNYYQPNYITGSAIDTKITDILVPVTDSFGAYIRNWNDPSFLELTNIPIREQLINLWDCSTICDISQYLPSYILEDDIITFKDYHGLIKTEKQRKNLSYNYVKTLDGLEFRYYENNINDIIYENNYSTFISLQKNPNIYQATLQTENLTDETNLPLTCFKYLKLESDNISFQANINIYKYDVETDTFNIVNNLDNIKVYYKIIPLLNYDKSSIYVSNLKTLNNIDDNHYEDLFTKEWFTSYNVNKTILDLIVNNTGAMKIQVKVLDPDGNILPIMTYYYFILNNDMDEDIINQVLYDSSYNSSIIYVQDPSNYKIELSLTDKFNLPYKHHDIVQWIQTPNGFKYYSKHTFADYNHHMNTYDITTSWDNSIIESPGFEDSNISFNTNKLFDFNIKFDTSNLDNSDTPPYLYIDTSTKGDQEYIRMVQVYQDSVLISNKKYENKTIIDDPDCIDGIKIVPPNGIIKIPISLPTAISNKDILSDASILNLLHLKQIEPSYNDTILFTVKYAIGNERICNHITTYEYSMTGYNEYRTLPEIILNTYNDMESLENLNKSINGILCNQFQYFTDIKINGFDNTNWGKVQQEIVKPKLEMVLILKSIIGQVDKETETDKETGTEEVIPLDKIMQIKYSLIKPNLDIFNTTQKALEDESNIFNMTDITDSYDLSNLSDEVNDNTKITVLKIVFELNDLDNIIDNYKLRTLIETSNPTGIYYESFIYVDRLRILYGNTVDSDDPEDENKHYYNLNHEYLVNNNTYLYSSKKIIAIISPISLIAGYNQTYPNISSINSIKWYGNENEITVSLKPYKLEKAIEQYQYSYLHRQNNPELLNWSGMKYKIRYLQDNIKSINVEPININYIKDLLPERLYNQEYLAKDRDDIYDSYLEIIYNSNIFNPVLIEDQDVIQYNNINYFASQYGQYGNKTALFIRQRIEHILRTDSLLNSMKAWNKLYETLKYDSDNAYPGHEETYGNGYQYLPTTADEGQYLEDGLMLLENVKIINNSLFFDMVNVEYIESELSKTSKVDEYTPEIYFRTLLYQMKWCYPKYGTDENGYNIINQIPLIKNKINVNEQIPENEMPYNLTYSIYPRIMFNDEEQINMVLMLRLPTIIKENQYEMTVKDLNYKEVEHINNINNPLKVLN